MSDEYPNHRINDETARNELSALSEFRLAMWSAHRTWCRPTDWVDLLQPIGC